MYPPCPPPPAFQYKKKITSRAPTPDSNTGLWLLNAKTSVVRFDRATGFHPLFTTFVCSQRSSHGDFGARKRTVRYISPVAFLELTFRNTRLRADDFSPAHTSRLGYSVTDLETETRKKKIVIIINGIDATKVFYPGVTDMHTTAAAVPTKAFVQFPPRPTPIGVCCCTGDERLSSASSSWHHDGGPIGFETRYKQRPTATVISIFFENCTVRRKCFLFSLK